MSHDLQYAVNQFHDVKLAGLQFKITSFEIRKVQQVIDQAD